MKRLMQATLIGVVVALLGASQSALAASTFEYAEGKECEIGGDIRLYLSHWDRDVVTPNWDIAGMEPGQAVEYLRVRERIWGCFEIGPDTMLTLRLVNRWQYFGSHFLDPNNQDAGYPLAMGSGNTWEFPDEVVIDNLFLDVANVFDSDWSLRIGRQDVALGNGMVLLEGTPFDQGRTIYFDGIVATRETEGDTLKLLLLYNRYKDPITLINDQNRVLRNGDTLILGVYWTHRMSETVNTDLYYLFADVDDDRDTTAAAVHAPDQNARLNIAGVRVFGKPTLQTAYSVELAQQFGDFGSAMNMNGREQELTGRMLDARLTLSASEGTMWSPSLTLQYLCLSGDDPSSPEELEGWHPAFAEYPMFREELTAITTNGNWTNFRLYRTVLELQLSEAVRLSGSWGAFVADYGETGTGGGDNMMHVIAGFVDYAVSESLTVSLEAAQAFPGNNYMDGHTAEWIRLATVFTF